MGHVPSPWFCCKKRPHWKIIFSFTSYLTLLPFCRLRVMLHDILVFDYIEKWILELEQELIFTLIYTRVSRILSLFLFLLRILFSILGFDHESNWCFDKSCDSFFLWWNSISWKSSFKKKTKKKFRSVSSKPICLPSKMNFKKTRLNTLSSRDRFLK